MGKHAWGSGNSPLKIQAKIVVIILIKDHKISEPPWKNALCI